MIQLRPYQEDAIQSIYTYYREGNRGNPYLALPTGTGKSVVIADFIRRAFSANPSHRILNLVHVQELIQQNHAKLVELWPMAPAGIYSAALKKKEVMPITFGGIASVAKIPELFGRIDLILVDECHLISPHQGSQYRTFITELKKTNSRLKVIGFSATPYRLGQGILTHDIVDKHGRVKEALFTDCCYDITGFEAFNQLIADGYLCPLVTRKTENEIDLSSVHILAGEYKEDELQAATDKEELTKAAVSEIISRAKERTRWLIFGTGTIHSFHVAEELRRRGIVAQAVSSNTPGDVRADVVKWFKETPQSAPEIRCIVNNDIFSTGFDAPYLDLIAWLRATKSTAKWVQGNGRGTRPAYGKQNCLVLDFAGNIRRLGPINDPILPVNKTAKRKGQDFAPIKLCESCGCYSHASVRMCSECGAEFPIAAKFSSVASEEEIIKTEKEEKKKEDIVVEIYKIDLVTYKYHTGRNGKLDSILVNYRCGLRVFNEYVCFDHTELPLHNAHDWWRRRVDKDARQFPTVPEAWELIQSKRVIPKVPLYAKVWLSKPYPKILAFDFDGNSFGIKSKEDIIDFMPEHLR